MFEIPAAARTGPDDAAIATAYHGLSGEMSDLIRSVFSLEVVFDDAMRGLNSKLVKAPPGFDVVLLTKEQNCALRYMTFHVGERAREFERAYRAGLGEKTDAEQ
jgi:hypothetical protein